jgi:hypothetical protein
VKEDHIMKNLKYALVAAAALGGLALASGTASAMPNGLSSAANAAPSEVQNVYWVCGAFGRCWWRPNYYYGAYGYYGPRPFWGPRFGWGGGWGHRWHRW